VNNLGGKGLDSDANRCFIFFQNNVNPKVIRSHVIPVSYGVEQIDDNGSKREWDFSNFGENML
jgi:hypothetical protein